MILLKLPDSERVRCRGVLGSERISRLTVLVDDGSAGVLSLMSSEMELSGSIPPRSGERPLWVEDTHSSMSHGTGLVLRFSTIQRYASPRVPLWPAPR
jgi:hypothetical protein